MIQGHTRDKGSHTRPGHLPVLPPRCLRDESKHSSQGIVHDGLETEGQSPSAGVISAPAQGLPPPLPQPLTLAPPHTTAHPAKGQWL